MDFANETCLYEAYTQHPNVRIDSRKVEQGDLFVGLEGTQAHGNTYAASALQKGAAFVIVDDPAVIPPGDDRYLLVPDSLAALQLLAVRHRQHQRIPVLAITGSNGKTTTKELIAAVMGRHYPIHFTPGNYNNHIGLPLTILSTPEATEMLILEMGANHQGEIAELCLIGRPTHGLITNIGEAHLEGFGGIPGVIAGKGELFDYLATHRGVAFINADEPYLSDMAQDATRNVYFQESDHLSTDVAPVEISVRQVHPDIVVNFLSSAGQTITAGVALSGRHNLQNVKAAIAIGRYFKVPAPDIAAALEDYLPTNHRSQLLERQGVRFYWDAYNANPSSVLAALKAFAEDHGYEEAVIVLGEMLELGPGSGDAHRRVVYQAGGIARTVVLVGEGTRAAAREFERPWFPDSEALASWFWRQDWSGRTVFVKGSRGNRLERVLEAAPVSAQ